MWCFAHFEHTRAIYTHVLGIPYQNMYRKYIPSHLDDCKRAMIARIEHETTQNNI